MHWFKIVLLVILVLSCLANLWRASKGRHMRKETPGTNATAAVIGVLLVVGVWLML